MIDIHSKHDNMHKNRMFYALIYINNHIITFIDCMLSGCSLEKEFTKLICMNPSVILYLTVNQVYSCHGCLCGPLT